MAQKHRENRFPNSTYSVWSFCPKSAVGIEAEGTHYSRWECVFA